MVKCFSGATSEDMEDFLKPIPRKEPENLILHVGTNDLKSMEPAQLTESIRSLAQQVEDNSPGTSLSISAILPRKDIQLSVISHINSSLKSVCHEFQCNFIEHSNIIREQHLNRGGLHLNKSGNIILANNFKSFINKE